MIANGRKVLGSSLLLGFLLISPSGKSTDAGPAVANAQLDELAQQLAGLLAEPGFRGFLRSEIARSKNSESIIDLGTFLARAARRPDAPPGLAKLTDAARRATATIESSLGDGLEGLDLYLPVDAHRTKWKGGEDFVVAFAPVQDEEDVRQIVGYDVRTGRPVALDPDREPDRVVLVLVPEEHETHELSRGEDGRERTSGPAKRAKSVRDRAPSRKPDFVGREPPEPAGEGQPGNSYMGFRRIYIRDVKEPWYRGDPEVYAVYGQRRGSYCETWRRGYSNSALYWADEERIWYRTWDPRGDSCSYLSYDDSGFLQVASLPMRETCWYYSTRMPDFAYNNFRVDIREYDGGDRRWVRYTLPQTGTHCEFPIRDGDDYIDHGYNYRIAFDYYREYRQDFGNAVVDFFKIH